MPQHSKPRAIADRGSRIEGGDAPINGPPPVTIVTKAPAEAVVSALSAALLLAELGCAVRVVCSTCAPETRALLTSGGVTRVEELLGRGGSRAVGGKLVNWMRFHRAAWRLLASIDRSELLWIPTADTAMALGRSLMRRRYVLSLRELYDKLPHYRLALKEFALRAASVVVPEYCRAHIFRSWYSLPVTPLVLPNKPHYHPRKRHLDLPAAAAGSLGAASHARLVLYQGHLGANRDLRQVAAAVASLGLPWRLAVMGRPNTDTLTSLSGLCPDLIVLPFIPAPDYLAVTSHAYIGVVNYSHRSLNEVFCAPNKLWEYAGFGVPTLCGDLPGLALSVAARGAGVCCDMGDHRSVRDALEEIDANWGAASQEATALYDSVDCRTIMSRIVERALEPQ